MGTRSIFLSKLFTSIFFILLFACGLVYAGAGDLDQSFGTGGIKIVNLNAPIASARHTDGTFATATTFFNPLHDLAAARYLANGNIDMSFSGDGIASAHFGSIEFGVDVIVQPDGKIIALGEKDQAPLKFFVLARFNTDGSLDNTFGVGGLVTVSISGTDVPSAITLQSDNKILVAGAADIFNGFTTTFDFVVARLNTDGTLDGTFGSGGRVITDLGGWDDRIYALAVQTDGKIVAAGEWGEPFEVDFGVVRYHTNGSLDTSFDGDGKVHVNLFGRPKEMVLQANGKIVVAGEGSDMAVIRLNTNGSLDNTFSGDGIALINNGVENRVDGIALQVDQKIVIGSVAVATNDEFALARLNPSGVQDPTFGINGIVVTPYTLNQQLVDIHLLNDQKILAIGNHFGQTMFQQYLNCAMQPATLPAGNLNVPYSVNLSVVGGVAPILYSISSGILPNGVTLDSSTGLLSGTPTQGGNYPIEIQAIDDTGCTAALQYNLLIICPENPSIVPAGPELPDGTINVSYNQSFTGTGGTSPYTITLASGFLPDGLNLDSGTISGTPLEDGPFNFQLSIVDANMCSGSHSYNLTIQCPTITLTSDVQDGTVGVAYSDSVSASGGIGPYLYSVSSGNLPPGITLNMNSGALTGSATSAGQYTFQITAVDSNGCSGFQNYTVDFTCPEVTLNPSALASGIVGTNYSETITASGTAPHTFSLVDSLPDGLGLNTSTGEISGIPTAPGTSNFTINATDTNGCSGSKAYSITVDCSTITVSPSTLDSGSVGNSYTVTFSADGGAVPYTFAVSSGALPDGLSLDSATGDLTGIPEVNDSNLFAIEATDANGCKGSTGYTLNVGTNCLFCDDFENDILDLDWLLSGLPWNEISGSMNGGDPTKKKKSVARLSNFLGCSTCAMETSFRIVAGADRYVLKIDGWSINDQNKLELMIKEGVDKVSLRLRSNGAVIQRAKAFLPIDLNTTYVVRMRFDGTKVDVFIDDMDTPVMTMVPKIPLPVGTFGYQIKSLGAEFHFINIVP